MSITAHNSMRVKSRSMGQIDLTEFKAIPDALLRQMRDRGDIVEPDGVTWTQVMHVTREEYFVYTRDNDPKVCIVFHVITGDFFDADGFKYTKHDLGLVYRDTFYGCVAAISGRMQTDNFEG